MNYRQRLHVLFVSTLSMIVVWVGILGWAEVARGQASYEVLHAFEQEAQYPTAGVIRDSTGNLYGTTDGGGASGYGSVYKLAPDGTFDILHSFNYSDGASPYAGGLLRDSVGNLYGTTVYGGASGYGNVYKLAPDGTLTLLHSFNYSEGANPSAGVIQDSTGNLYGTTLYGGASGAGTVYKLAPDGTLTLLHSFNFSEGYYPYAGGVIQDSTGNLYGTTYYGGASGAGTVYKLAPDGTLTLLHSFNFSEGYYPTAGVIQDSTGNLYGTTPYGGASGGGVVFAIENHPPVANAGPNQTVTAGADCQATVTLDGSGSSDPDDDALTFTWTGPFGTASGPTPTVSLPVGTHTTTLTVDDGKGGTTSDTVTMTVVDTTPPNIASVTASLNVLWPPDHRMVPEVVTVSASDTCSAAPVCKITSVSSNEPANGLGDGDMAPDWEIRGDLTLNLRAERSGKGSGRGYTITMRCADASGNSSTKTVAVTVPHDQPKK